MTFANRKKVAKSININIEGLNPEYNYCAMGVTGDYMNSDKSSIKVKDGDKIVIHEIPINKTSILNELNSTLTD